jgi:BolA family transcriptional regulator, general stress-responsive regulator
LPEVDHQAEISPGHRIEAVLHAALAPSSLSVLDESHLHATHAHLIKQKAHLSKQIGAATASSGTHFRIKIVSEAFRGKSRIERHRIINQLLSAEFEGSLHALAIEAKAPAE